MSATNTANGGTTATDGVVHGQALIFWDPERPGKKLAAIDTDQITPAADCVSESLEELDRRWKEGSFRYLMPDFRERVHRGETFVIAGDRFAIGSSREMSPAGLKAVANLPGARGTGRGLVRGFLETAGEPLLALPLGDRPQQCDHQHEQRDGEHDDEGDEPSAP